MSDRYVIISSSVWADYVAFLVLPLKWFTDNPFSARNLNGQVGFELELDCTKIT